MAGKAKLAGGSQHTKTRGLEMLKAGAKAAAVAEACGVHLSTVYNWRGSMNDKPVPRASPVTKEDFLQKQIDISKTAPTGPAVRQQNTQDSPYLGTSVRFDEEKTVKSRVPALKADPLLWLTDHGPPDGLDAKTGVPMAKVVKQPEVTAEQPDAENIPQEAAARPKPAPPSINKAFEEAVLPMEKENKVSKEKLPPAQPMVPNQTKRGELPESVVELLLGAYLQAVYSDGDDVLLLFENYKKSPSTLHLLRVQGAVFDLLQPEGGGGAAIHP